MAGVEGKDRGIHKEDKTGGSWSEKNKISHFIPVWTAASCSCGSGSEEDVYKRQVLKEHISVLCAMTLERSFRWAAVWKNLSVRKSAVS